ncbi:hypothetical protein WR25_08361 isoform I [Diploscapter pachys]|uniref:Cytochrome P450 n=1 Tax=Diploscapter pachys TaxID=2018661 RepID=A0A2A2KGP9_9BILA|nr:hypothetical protein WR25_08361 isoform C [Diploscapter pachys]PAV73159.1 hypothetical protein WR25_08361 isoform D [Diploscapter pachys]PAV73162.1 hypothetical protein WR25_08361 isoform G [Diploscapter pachys]PAV73164.1 hypothetical protein WR25_08361 isoform I [Diploscapter pachys]
MATDAFVKKGQSFAERWEPPIFAALNDGLGLVSSSGDYWVEQKRFTLHVLRNLGVSRNLMEERILEEFHLRLDNISPNEIIDADSLFGLITANILNRVLFSYSFDDKNLEFYFESKRKHEEHYKILGFYHLCLPKWVVKTPFLRSTLDTLMEPILESKHFVRANITERIRAIKDGTREIGEDPSDYVDSFLLHMDKLRKESGEDDSSFNLETLVANVFDLYEAGQNSTSRTLSLGFFYLLHNPRLVKKIREELRNATGGTRDVLQSDKPRTPWLNAAINVRLIISVVILLLWHQSELVINTTFY